MKTLKRTEQRNVRVNRDMVSVKELRVLIEDSLVTVMNHNYTQLELADLDFMYDSPSSLDDYDLLVFLENTKEIKVVYDKEYGFYDNVVVMENGIKISIHL